MVRSDAILPPEEGCWIDGTWGRFGSARLIQLASYRGYNEIEVVEAADAMLKSMGPSRSIVTDEQEELVYDAADEVETWMNDHVAPAGFSFGWEDGELYLWSDKNWEARS